MANKDQVKGFQPFGPVLRAQSYLAGGTVYEGDLVKQGGAGDVVAGTAGAAAIGVALNYATSGQQVLVADHPDQMFVGQVDDSSVDAQTDLGLNYSLVAGSANTTYRTSGMEIDGDTQHTNVLELKVLRILPAADNALGANVKCVCKINIHQLGSVGVAGV
jgi:hypothetical protein